MANYPQWAREMSEIFKSGSISQFLLYGNVDDWVTYAGENNQQLQCLSLKDFLTRVMFAPFEVVLTYDRGHGIRASKGGELFFNFLKAFDSFHRTGFATATDGDITSESGGALPKDPKRALALIDRFIRHGLVRTTADKSGKPVANPMRVAVIVEYAQYLLPRAEIAYTSSESVETLIRVFDWAADPSINSAYVTTCLVAENLNDVNRQLVENPRSAKIQISLPDSETVLNFVQAITATVSDFSTICDVDRESLAQKLEGLSCIDVQNLIERAVKNQRRITMEYLREVKKEMIEKSAGGRITFVESQRNLDDVAGHSEAKAWFRQDASLMKRGKIKALPMGYLITGRIGTGKTYLVECFAGEAGVPCVELKNFRDKWVGATEGNLEAIFKILHAMGQVIVFIDEADQVAGKRDGNSGDSGVSGRIYAMLAREMADTRNRGRIFWIFATSRPDLLEVDLKRVGRLDVHIPLFAPQTLDDKKALFKALARKNKIKLEESDIPDFPESLDIGGNEMEGMLIMASRMLELQEEDAPDRKPVGEFIREALKSYRPMAHSARLEYMDLAAVFECTDQRFLPEKFSKLETDAIKSRMDELKIEMSE
ncbi:MAG TPA: AAA family ATPase [Candidatus Rifleibacterium sp.]|nr:AAA family ATPase [Candidatus Rifleibacterium sp.]HPT44416.1 AAA family ATPase [Candidatus Rifleibacterium sp.]